MDQKKRFHNPFFSEELNKFLNVMLKHEFSGKDKLIKQLNNLRIKKIEEDAGFKAFVFEVVDQNLLDYEGIPYPAIDMLVFNNLHYTTEFILHWGECVKELEIFNIAGEDYLELENFEDIEFLD
ncbi:hypothetical protein [uncultured Campylobacter sp.]|uniref:hypothetical protein n=1 Tax=uncultured Campylobacter sp. TaxID=218934 RepID=UPI0026328BF0|nr:hypothetical protein [uncultured Campylobacter sp.]